MIRDTSDQDVVLPQRRPGLTPLAVGLAVAALLGAIFLVWSGGSGATLSVERDKVRVATVKRGDLVRDISVQGRVVAAIKPVIYSPAAGRVSIHVRAGDEVAEGQLLATIDSPALTTRLKQEESRLESLSTEVDRQEIETRTERLSLKQQLDMAEVALIAARREMRRAEIAFDKNAISLQDHEKASDDLYTADLAFKHRSEENVLRIERLELELNIRNQELERQQVLVDDLARQVAELEISSPVTGVVGNLEANEKDAVSEYQPLMSVVDLSTYEVEINVPESFAEDLVTGLGVEITEGQRRLAGTVASVSPEVESGQVRCRVRIAGEVQQDLRQNQRVSARILLETRPDVRLVARGNFLQSGGGGVAYVVIDDLAVRRSITTGSTSVSQVEIVDGLNEGDVIVVSGVSFFDDADTVLLID